MQRATTTIFYTAAAPGTLTAHGTVRGFIAGVPSFFSRTLHACLLIRDPTGATYAADSDCFYKDEPVRDVTVTKTVTAGERLQLEFMAENVWDVGAATLELPRLNFSIT